MLDPESGLALRLHALRDRLRGRRAAVFHPEFLDDLRSWVRTDRKTALRALVAVANPIDTAVNDLTVATSAGGTDGDQRVVHDAGSLAHLDHPPSPRERVGRQGSRAAA